MSDRRIEISTSVIIHATESSEKVLRSIEDVLGLAVEEFSSNVTTGHFGNPITVLSNHTLGRATGDLCMQRFRRSLPPEQLEDLVEQIEERTVDSRFHVRVDKQTLVRDGKLDAVMNSGGSSGSSSSSSVDTIRIKIHTPIYNKKDTTLTVTLVGSHNLYPL